MKNVLFIEQSHKPASSVTIELNPGILNAISPKSSYD